MDLRKKSFEGITAGLSRMVADLRGFAQEQEAEGARKDAEAARLMTEAKSHDDEGARARSTAAKIEGLLV